MAKRKVRDDAEPTAAPAKKTKTTAKKGKKAADEDGTYIVVHFIRIISKSALQTCRGGDGRLNGDWWCLSPRHAHWLAPMAVLEAMRHSEHRRPTLIPIRFSTQVQGLAQPYPDFPSNLPLPVCASPSLYSAPPTTPRQALCAIHSALAAELDVIACLFGHLRKR
jgi:hypothetical protein